VYHEPFFATLGALAGIYIVLSFSWVISQYNWLSYIPMVIGESSLFILMFHLFAGKKSYDILSQIFIDYELFVVIISFVLSIFLPIFIKYIVVRSKILSLIFFPFKSNNLFFYKLKK
jgi:hypothetical protein